MASSTTSCGSRLWLAAGWIVEGENRPRAATWTSVDGIAWEAGAQIGPDPVPGPEGMSFRIDDVLVLADELIAFGWNHVGCCDGGQAALWRSTDGVNWTFVDATGTDYGETYHFPIDAAVAPTGELVLVSAIGLGGGAPSFTSSDGVTWVEQPVDGEGTIIGSVAASDTTLLAVEPGCEPGGTDRGRLDLVGRSLVVSRGPSGGERRSLRGCLGRSIRTIRDRREQCRRAALPRPGRPRMERAGARRPSRMWTGPPPPLARRTG